MDVSGLIAGVDRAEAALNAGFRRALDSSDEIMRKSIAKTFQSGGRPEAWAANAPFTLRRKRAKNQGDKPLIATGALLEELTDKSSGVQLPGSLELDRGTSRVDARRHQFGHESGPPGEPARPFLVILPEDAIAIEDAFAKDLQKRIVDESFHGIGGNT